MEPQNPQDRIAELERQLAQAKAVAPSNAVSPLTFDLQYGSAPHSQPTPTPYPPGYPLSRIPPSQPQRRISRGRRLTVIFWIAFAVCMGALMWATAGLALFPSSALWIGGIVCNSPYHLQYQSSDYSYKPGQSGNIINYLCVDGARSFDPGITLLADQFFLAALVLGVVAVVGVLIWRAR